MRILIVSNFYPPAIVGGAEIVAHRHALELKRRGHDVAVFAGRAPKDAADVGTFDVEETDGLTIYRLAMRSLSTDTNFHWPSAARRFQSVVQTEQPDIVHFHNVTGLGANLLPEARRLGRRIVVTLHDHWGFCYKNTRLKSASAVCNNFHDCYQCQTHYRTEGGCDLPIRMRRDYVSWCLDLADQLCAPSRYLAEAYRSAQIGSADVVGRSNGIDLARFEDLERSKSERIRFTAIGYLGEHKGLPLLMDAVRRLLERHDLRGLWELKIAGDGHLKEWLEREIVALGESVPVAFLGKVPRDEVVRLFGDTDVLLLPSIWPENEPVVLLEAIAAGCAQLASGHGGNVELVAHGKGGFLFQPGRPDSLAEAMIRFLEEPGLAAAFGAWNRNRRILFDEVASVDGYESDYHRLSSAMPSDRPGPRHPVIICAGGWPPLPTAHVVNNFAHLSPDLSSVRFIWEEYACPIAWENAAAVWIWADRPADTVIRQAMRRGVPVLASRYQEQALALDRIGGYALTYSDPIEAIATISTLLRRRQELPELMRGSEHIADVLAAVADASSFALAAELP